MKKTKILIDSGTSNNIGDNAMLFNIVSYLNNYLNADLNIIGKDVSFNFKKIDVNLLKNNSTLQVMPHWRIACYRKQLLIFKPFFELTFWIFSILKLYKLKKSILFYQKFKKFKYKENIINYWTEHLYKMDAFWVVGGGNLNDYWTEQAFWKLGFAKIFNELGKTVIFSGQGIGPANNSYTRIILKMGIKYIDLLGLREEFSKSLLKKLRIRSKNYFVTADDALTLKEIGSQKNTSSKPFIAINIRKSFYSLNSENSMNMFADFIQTLHDQFPDHIIKFIPIALNKTDSDIDTAERIINLIADKSYTEIMTEATVNNIKSLIKHATLSIGISYHFCLFSLSSGVPTIGLYSNPYYKQKISGLFNLFNIKNSTFDLNSISSENLATECRKLLRDFNKLKLDESCKLLEKEWNNFMQDAVNLINGSKNEQ